MTTEEDNNEPEGTEPEATETATSMSEASDAEQPEEGVSDEVVAAVDEAVAHGNNAPEAGETVGGAMANLWGVSRPQDEYGTRASDRDGMSDEELLAMGVEPDAGPSNTLMATFIGLIGIVIVTCVIVGAIFHMSRVRWDAAMAGAPDHLLTTLQTEARAILGEYAEVEPAEDSGAAVGYRIPIAVAMDLVVDEGGLLARHPLGSRTPEAVVLPDGTTLQDRLAAEAAEAAAAAALAEEAAAAAAAAAALDPTGADPAQGGQIQLVPPTPQVVRPTNTVAPAVQPGHEGHGH